MTQERKNIAKEERVNLARDLHDDLCQVLSYINMQSQACIKFITDKKLKQTVYTLNQLIVTNQRAYDHVRSYISCVGKEEGEDGFLEALQEYMSVVRNEYGLAVEAHISQEVNTLVESCASMELLRIVQEAFANVYKHAGATHVIFSMEEDRGYIKIIICDNGKGFDIASSSFITGFGITNMYNRAKKLGGSFKIISTPGLGTKIMVEIPIRGCVAT